MITVFKYKLPVGLDPGIVEMPIGAEILKVGHAAEDPSVMLTIWAKVDTAAGVEDRKFFVTGTGHELPRHAAGALEHLGTVQVPAGFVWHIWQQVRR